jgi:hypothetical protein
VKVLAFARSGAGTDRLRRARFETRSSLPVSAVCVVASGVRETLASLLGAPVVLRVFDPAIPLPQAWPIITGDAALYRVRGSVADAALVLRRRDADALVCALFGESQEGREQRALSPLEREVLHRTAQALAANLAAVCGQRETNAVEPLAVADGFVTFFELQVEEPVALRIGVALSADPKPEPRGSLEIGALSNVEVPAVASLDAGVIEAGAVARLAAGSSLPIRPRNLECCSLHGAGVRLARGICGVRGGRYAFVAGAAEERA